MHLWCFFYRKPMGSWENTIMLISLSVVQCIAMVPLSFRILCVFQLIFSLASVKIYPHVIKARKRVNLQRETRRAWVSQLWRSWWWWRWVGGGSPKVSTTLMGARTGEDWGGADCCHQNEFSQSRPANPSILWYWVSTTQWQSYWIFVDA